MENQIKILNKTLDAHIESLELIRQNKKDFFEVFEFLKNIKGRIVFLGIGKSAIVAQKCNATFNSLNIKSAFLHAAEALHGDFGLLDKGDVIVAFSQSGETIDTCRVAMTARRNGFKIISVTSNPESSLAKNSDYLIMSDIKNEGSIHNLAPMASVSKMIVVGDILANLIAYHREFSMHDFAVSHPGGSLGLKLTPVSKIISDDSSTPLIGNDADLFSILDIINKKKKGIVGIINNDNKLIGAISDGDIRRLLVKHKNSSFNLKAKDIMTFHPKTIIMSDSAFDALNLMQKFKITSLFVVDETNKPIAILHMHDIIDRSLI